MGRRAACDIYWHGVSFHDNENIVSGQVNKFPGKLHWTNGFKRINSYQHIQSINWNRFPISRFNYLEWAWSYYYQKPISFWLWPSSKTTGNLYVKMLPIDQLSVAVVQWTLIYTPRKVQSLGHLLFMSVNTSRPSNSVTVMYDDVCAINTDTDNKYWHTAFLPWKNLVKLFGFKCHVTLAVILA